MNDYMQTLREFMLERLSQARDDLDRMRKLYDSVQNPDAQYGSSGITYRQLLEKDIIRVNKLEQALLLVDQADSL